MLNTFKNTLPIGAIALGLIAFSPSSSVNAQTNTSDSFEFDTIEVGDSNWNFNSENETISVQDDLQELRQYSISDLEETDVRLIEEEKLWGNQGDIGDYSVETDIYDY